jgi:tRNA pseudouridine13 synthase
MSAPMSSLQSRPARVTTMSDSDSAAGEEIGSSESTPGRSTNGPRRMHSACGLALPSDWITLGEPRLRPDPRPGPSASKVAGIGGILKERAEDFIVEELPLYDPSGTGEHIYIGVQKSNMPHTEMLGLICRHFKVEESAIGFAGMKDRVAVTQQTLSIHMPVDRTVGEFRHDRLAVMWAKRHTNKLRRGHLRGNRFVIRIRGVDPMKVRTAHTRMNELAKFGIPDYFGEQRFGYRVNNHVIGLSCARGEWKAALDEMLGAHGTPFPPHQRAVRECYDRGDFEIGAEMWGRNDQAERIAMRALARGRDAQGAIRAIPGHIRSFWMSALQGAVYNATLAARVADGSFSDILPGDVAILAGKNSLFPVAIDVAADELATLRARCAALDLSAAGPIHGPSLVAAAGAPLAYERAALAHFGAEASLFAPPILEAEGARRPFRITMQDWAVDAGVDEHGGYIRLAFDLPKGAFATVLCRELLGDMPESSTEQ